MTVSNSKKESIKSQIREKLSKEQEIQKIVLFGSFVNSDNPNDIDIAVFQNSNEKYLSLSLKYRKLVRDISKILPVDVIPLRINAKGTFIHEIEAGEIIYER
ncbi:hypothetical protein A2V82_07355 [candidate division KSB1 bacterium RBG_16_48_16]|nr:MAG: hypothetical protein A2V82_07355 [candidate division KSB1 bacterium RBG_16_48_16]